MGRASPCWGGLPWVLSPKLVGPAGGVLFESRFEALLPAINLCIVLTEDHVDKVLVHAAERKPDTLCELRK